MSVDFFMILVAAYLIGSVNFAILVSRFSALPDPRTQGSQNPGATNMYRIGGKSTAVKVLSLDVVKGIIPTWGSYYLGLSPNEIGITAIACCLGHMFPIFHRFQGGKAVATAFGCLLPVGLSLGAVLFISWVVVLKITGYSSLAAIVAVSLSPLVTYLIAPKYTLAVTMLAVFIILRHTPNILRLLRNEEPKSRQRL
jgi:acyl phosphate:glycerol-3-phosphate acyltransferase